MMEKRDVVLLAHLRKNGRAKLKHISTQTDIPVSTLFERIRNPLGSYIAKYTCIINNTEIGFNSRATIILKVDKEQKHEISQFLEKHQNVNSLYRINNGYDFLLDVIFRQMGEMEEFIEQLERKFRIKQKEVYFIIDEVKQESFLADPQTAWFLFDDSAAGKRKQAATADQQQNRKG
ncbi:Lrp/AsnC family transcriptional regulator [Candidatus Woesearchaeota archaeon]|nr:Lrp/AsnC family transcriptional regulator [Candidatus Woesearchaeota archaeon]